MLNSCYFEPHMRRTEIAKAIGGEKIGDKLKIMGWVRTFRSNRFISVNDGSTIKNIQAVVDFENFDAELLKRITTEHRYPSKDCS